MREGWNVILRYDEALAGANIWLVHKQGEQETVVNPINLTMTTTISPAIPPEPTITIDRTSAHQFLQGLADGLVDAGFRPDELKSKDKEIEAIKYHLEDMRNIVMNALLPPELPPKYIGREK